MGEILERNLFLTDENKKMVLTCLRLETSSNIYYFWSFTMHSISSSKFLRPWFTSSSFFPRRARYSNHSSDSSMRDILKEGNFFTDENKKIGFNLSTLRNRFQHLLLLKFHHALKSSLKLLFSALVQFDSVLLEENKIQCSSQRFILGGTLKRSNFFRDESNKMVLTCLRLETGSNIYYFWSFTMHSIYSSNFFMRPWCIFTQF